MAAWGDLRLLVGCQRPLGDCAWGVTRSMFLMSIPFALATMLSAVVTLEMPAPSCSCTVGLSVVIPAGCFMLAVENGVVRLVARWRAGVLTGYIEWRIRPRSLSRGLLLVATCIRCATLIVQIVGVLEHRQRGMHSPSRPCFVGSTGNCVGERTQPCPEKQRPHSQRTVH